MRVWCNLCLLRLTENEMVCRLIHINTILLIITNGIVYICKLRLKIVI